MTRLLVALGLLCVTPALLGAQDQPDSTRVDSTGPGVRASLGAPRLVVRVPSVLRAIRPLDLALPPGHPEVERAALDSARAEWTQARLSATLYRPEPDLIAAEEDSLRRLAQRGLLGINRDLVDLQIDGQLRLEIRTDRLRNERCTPLAQNDPNSGCRGKFSAPRLDNQFMIRAGGLIGRRLRVSVDWDSQRDYTNSNSVQVYYEGLEDEIIRRIEVGSVAFRPPPSRFVTAGIPANNFGVNATFEVGPVQLQTLAATQKGSTVGERVYTIGQTTTQPQDRALRDLDFEYGRFFWVVDPLTVPGFPNVDVLTLDQVQVPASVRPSQVRIYRYRVPQSGSTTDPNLGGIPACARQGSTTRTIGPVSWQLLVLGEDYYVDPSGLWLALGQKIDLRSDFIAVSYITEDGTPVGSFPDQPDPSPGTSCATVDSLALIAEPLVSADQPSFRHEMRQFYRVAGRDLDAPSLSISVALNRSERPQGGGAQTYLQALGLAVPTDPNVFDRENRLFPRGRDPGADQVLRESFVVLPSAQPFADPARLQPQERNDSLYRTPVYLLFQQGPPAKFQFRLRYNSMGAGDRSTLNLNALQIREGSEQLSLGGRLLERGVDYDIAYETGQVTFKNPDALFGSGAATITARFEERGLFAVAPTTILGGTLRYDLGRFGAINLVGIYQKESSAFNRPPLGFEASANLVAGATTELHFKPEFVTRFLNGLTSQPAIAESRLDVNAEVAFTKPDPNRSGQAYLEEFESEAGSAIPMRETSWTPGAAPQSTAGVDDVLGGSPFEPADAVQLIWQNLVQSGSSFAQFLPQDIDPNISTAGRTPVPETVLFLTFHADTAGGVVQNNRRSRWSLPERPGRPRWRSMQTSLSAVGLDFSRNEFLEFWVYELGNRSADSAQVRLVLDLGTVDEDAIALAPDSLLVSGTDTTFRGRQLVGLGRLDTERRPSGIFNAATDDIGTLGDRPDLNTVSGPLPAFALCRQVLSGAVQVFPWGDLSARCSNGNSVLDTEDLDGDNALNARGSSDNVIRFVVDLRDPRYFVRNGVQDLATGAGWRLFRVPLRTPDATVGTPNVRLVQHLRVTLVAPDLGEPDRVARLALARIRVVGSPWVRRADAPIAGISGSTAGPVGEIAASIVSTLDSTDLGYVSPPGVIAAIGRRDQASGQGIQINERSLRIIGREMAQDTRAEAYLRFTAGPQRFLGYREMRLWMRGRPGTPGWESGELEGFIKVGSDDQNFYMYRTRLRSDGREAAWEPEVSISLDRWRQLRAVVEQRWLNGEPPSGADVCGGDPNAYVACSDGYVVHLGTPGINPPNLAAVQELAAGVIRVGAGTSDSAEMWVDDIRLVDPVSDRGVAWAMDARLTGSDVFDFSLLATHVDGQFRQIGDQPTFRTSNVLALGTTVRLDRFLPRQLGLLLPVTVTHTRNTVAPELVSGTDIDASSLPTLRRPEAHSTSYALTLRRATRSRDWLTRIFADPVVVNATYSSGDAVTELSRAESKSYSLGLNYSLQLTRKGPRLPTAGLARALPRWLRESEFGRGLENPTASLNPTAVRISSTLTRDQSDYFAYLVPIERPTDAALSPTVALTHLWRNSAGVTWQPLGMLTMAGDLSQTRDLRHYGDSTALARLATSERKTLLGIPIGTERDRILTTTLSLTPRIASWLRPRFVTSSNFAMVRTLNSRRVVREEGDTGGAFFLPQTLNNGRSREIGVALDYGRGLRQLAGDSSWVAGLVRRFRVLDLSRRRSRTSTYDLAAFNPDLSYMLGLGGLGDFVAQEGNLAIGASESHTTTAATGLDFPFGLTATVAYSEVNTDRYQRLAQGLVVSEITSREWPSGSLRLSRTLRGGPLAFFALGTGVRRRLGTTTQPGPGGSVVSNSNESRSLTPDMQLTFRSGVALTASYSDLDQENRNNGNVTLLEQQDVTGTVSYAFPLPQAISRRRRMMRTQVTALISQSEQCLQRTGQAECEAISDTRRQEFRAALDTDVLSSLTASLQGGYTANEARHLNRKTTQIFFLLSFNLSLFAGDYR